MKASERKKVSKKSVIWMVSILMMIIVAIGTTLAILMTKTDEVENTFTPSKVTTSVEENIENGVKSDVKIQNTGNTEAYIRAAVIITWQDASGNVYGQQPMAGEDKDYTIEYDLDSGWELGADGFYYWTKPVKASKNTGALIERCVLNDSNTAPEGYSLNVEIIGSGIQSLPTTVVTNEWSSGVSGVKEVGGVNTLVIKQQGGGGE